MLRFKRSLGRCRVHSFTFQTFGRKKILPYWIWNDIAFYLEFCSGLCKEFNGSVDEIIEKN